jgi:hypothetical protein
MKKFLKINCLLFLSLFLFQGCQIDKDDIIQPLAANVEVQNFIWKGLNQYYLWQPDVPNLADNRFANQTALDAFLVNYKVPEKLFDALRVAKTTDRFSWMVDDYVTLEQSLQGTTKNSGVEFGLSQYSNGSNEIFGYVRYIIPDSDAASKNIKRGDVFTAVNGTPLTVSNYQSLLFGANDTFTLNMADISNNSIIPNNKSVSLTKTVLAENPILVNKVISTGRNKIGYLMYNGFYAPYDTKLNDAFGYLKSEGITDFPAVNAAHLSKHIDRSILYKIFKDGR